MFVTVICKLKFIQQKDICSEEINRRTQSLYKEAALADEDEMTITTSADVRLPLSASNGYSFWFIENMSQIIQNISGLGFV